MIKIGLAQVASGNTKKESLEIARNIIKEASTQNVDLLVFPELFMMYIDQDAPKSDFFNTSEPLNGNFVSTLANEAKNNKMYISVGIYERNNTDVHNTNILINSRGEVESANRKLHPFDAFNYNESDRLTPGNTPGKVVNTAMGKIGTLLCYDLRFPEVARMQTLLGAEIILAPAAWVAGKMKIEQWITLLKARAIENTVFIIGCCQPGRIFIGNSMIVNPFGEVICHAKDSTGLITAEINISNIKNTRKVLPCLKQLRTDIINEFWKKY